MFTRGEFTVDNVTYGVVMSHTKEHTEAILITSGTVVSAYKVDATGSYSYNNVRAKELVKLIQTGLKGCTSKNCVPMPFQLGAMNQHEFIKSKIEYIIQLYRGEVVGAFIQSSDKRVEIEYNDNVSIPNNIPYVKLTEVKKNREIVESDLDAIQTRSVQEIALEKEDITWLKYKKYFVVKDDSVAEQIFEFLDQYNGPISYDTETTGLKINCFGQINSKYQHDLEKYNTEHSDNPIRADRLVGIIFCVEENTSYYFPCFNRKFKNLYQELDSPIRNRIIQNTKSRYVIGDLKDETNSIAEYWRKTPANEISSDCILMERVRNILQTKHIVAHNGSFEYKVGMQYWIDTNLKDDTMILHQIAYKFRNGGGRAEPSNLKYLAKKELGVDQWELKDFFPNWKPDKEGLVRRKPGSKINIGNQIDFSYMDEEGVRVYAPTDGDVTLGLFHKFKADLLANHKEIEYIYNVEVLVACAVGYMEFYGHRIDESKILSARAETMANKSIIVSDIRQLIDYADDKELAAYNQLKEFRERKKELISPRNEIKTGGKLSEDEYNNKLIELVSKLDEAIESNTQKQINLGSPAQACDLFYNKLGIPFSGDKQSVAKKVIKALLKEKNDDGTPKYPVVHLYSKYKNEETLLSKFFDNLIYFTYPGGYIFSSFGQIATNTGRMSCSKPNCQQYPKVITKIIIPRDGYIMMDADYSQIEYRVLTAMAGNEWLAELFSDPDSDYHTLMASLMYDVDYSAVTATMRSAAKSFNFGLPYGMGLGSLAILLTGKNTAQTRDEVAEKMEDYFRNQPKTRKFFNNVKEMAQVNGYTRTLFNRYRYYSFTDKDGNVNNAKKAAALRQAGNAVIQGCLHGDTLIHTKELGIVKIKDAVNKHLMVWNGKEWTNGDILYSGKKKKCIVKFNNGQEFICSPTHKFLKHEHDAGNIENYIECKNLKASDTIAINQSDNSELKIKNYKQHNSLSVNSVEITDEYIDMYDVCNTDDGYYVADGIITHNTAADIFKIGVARNFSFIRRNHLLGKLLIINMVHDEQLMEIDAQHLNVQRIVAEVGNNMQFKVDGFPPLFIGAGLGKAWGYAKGKAAEIHPLLLDEFTKEAQNIPIYRSPEEIANQPTVDTNKILEYFDNRIYEFRRKKVADYLSNPENWHKAIYPAISSLINLQFNYGRGDDAKAYVGPNGETYDDQQFLELNIGDFLKENHISAEPSWFKAGDNKAEDEEEDKEYSDGEDTDDDEMELLEGDEDIRSFTLIDESDKTFGSSIHDMINIFGACILPQQRICGINTKNMYFKKKDVLIDYLMQYMCDEDESEGLQIVFLTDANVLKYTGIYVKNLNNDKLEEAYKNANALSSDYTEGDIKNRSQAK